jgi:murein L,D-transpeptidase YcbB/YkuD
MEIAKYVQIPLYTVYEARGFMPLWLKEDGEPTERAEQTIAAFNNASEDGLNPTDYNVFALQQTLINMKQKSGNDQQQAAFDLAMSRSLARFVEDLSVGRVTPQQLDIAIDVSLKKAALPQKIQQMLTTDDVTSTATAISPRIPLYSDLRRLLAEYRLLAEQHPLAPSLPPLPSKKLTAGDVWVGTPALADWLKVLSYLPTNVEVTEQYDGEIVEAVKHFQRHQGLTTDGVIGKQTYQSLLTPLPVRVKQITLAMERLRWLDDDLLYKRFVIINIPEFTLRAFSPDNDGIKTVLEMAVVVGQAHKNETPLMSKTLNSLVFSPYWNVPRSIAIKELLPKLRSDPHYLVKENMELVDNNGMTHGSAVGVNELEGIRYAEYRIRQRPGTKNALGELKFVFPNDDAIYMHDTPSKPLFARERRDFSHGCVRLANPMAFALFALETQGEWDETKIREKISLGTEQHQVLRERMPVLLLYITATVDGEGNAVFLPDIYNQDEKLDAALSRRNQFIQQ